MGIEDLMQVALTREEFVEHLKRAQTPESVLAKVYNAIVDRWPGEFIKYPEFRRNILFDEVGDVIRILTHDKDLNQPASEIKPVAQLGSIGQAALMTLVVAYSTYGSEFKLGPPKLVNISEEYATITTGVLEELIAPPGTLHTKEQLAKVIKHYMAHLDLPKNTTDYKEGLRGLWDSIYTFAQLYNLNFWDALKTETESWLKYSWKGADARDEHNFIVNPGAAMGLVVLIGSASEMPQAAKAVLESKTPVIVVATYLVKPEDEGESHSLQELFVSPEKITGVISTEGVPTSHLGPFMQDEHPTIPTVVSARLPELHAGDHLGLALGGEKTGMFARYEVLKCPHPQATS